MRLLIFAHYGEAQVFLENTLYKKKKTPFGDYYESSDGYLFISGEGIYNTLVSLGSIYTQFSEAPTSIWNFGVAGSISSLHTSFDVVFVRTSYSCQEHEMNFQSFSTSDTDSTVDCISSMKRILTQKDLKRLPHFGHIVDRELWAIGMIAQRYKIPWRACKVISDQAGLFNRCSDVIDKSNEYSTKLFACYYEHCLVKTASSAGMILIGDDTILEQHWSLVLDILNISTNILYMTYSQKESQHSLLKRLSVMYEDKRDLLVDNLLLACSVLDISFHDSIKGTNKKQNMSKILKVLEFCLDPIFSSKLHQYQEFANVLRKGGVAFRFDPSFEKNVYQFIFSVKSQKELFEQMQKLEKLDFTNIFQK